jgi:cobalt-zinc-cadmium efflux system membrane fusion protein
MATTLTLAMGLMSGCGQTSSTPAQAEKHTDTHDDHDNEEHAATENGGHDHSGWWCNEHGVPEEFCGQCNSKLAADFQKKGDWCKEHDRPDSQCFKCHPELQAKFAAQYEAKFGKKPPTPEG